MWTFDQTKQLWTWLHGLNVTDQESIRDDELMNFPGSRYSSNVWVDNNGIAWLYGGTTTSNNNLTNHINNNLIPQMGHMQICGHLMLTIKSHGLG